MAQKRTPGLILRGRIWWIDKQVRGYGRIRQSCETGDRDRAEEVLANKLEEVRKAKQFGVRPTRTFREAATYYLETQIHKRSIGRDAQDLALIEPYIGDLDLRLVHMGTLEKFIKVRQGQGRAAGTINRTLRVVRRVLNLAARLWRDENGLSWLETAPMIVQVPDRDKRKPYPISFDEQDLFFPLLPEHLREMAEYKVNTGCREREVVQLRWEWERAIPELETSVFVLPEWLTKNGIPRIVVLNSVAKAVIERQRGKHETRVFTFHGQPVTKMYNSAWTRAREDLADEVAKKAGRECPWGLANLRVHDLKHTFGRRLRAAGVDFEDRQDLLGHKSMRVTTDYSNAEILNLISAAEKAVQRSSHKSPTVLSLVRTNAA